MQMGVKESENIKLIPSLRTPSKKTSTHHQIRRISSPGIFQTSTRPLTPSSVLKSVNKHHREDEDQPEIVVSSPSIIEPQNKVQEVLSHKFDLDNPAVIGSGVKLHMKAPFSSSSMSPSEVAFERQQTPNTIKPEGTILSNRPSSSSSPRSNVPAKYLGSKSASPSKDLNDRKLGTQAYAGPKFMNSPPPTELPLPRFTSVNALESTGTFELSEPIGKSETEFTGHPHPLISPQPSPSTGHDIGLDSTIRKDFRSKPQIVERNSPHNSYIHSMQSNRTPESRISGDLSSSKTDVLRPDSELARLSLDFKTFLMSGQTSSSP